MMSRLSRLVGTTGAILVIGLSSIAGASTTGTPAANRVPAGKGKSVNRLFDDMVGGDHGKQATGANGEKSKSARKHLTNKEWREAYIARYGHLPVLSHPGH
jgi:hypothetical protein